MATSSINTCPLCGQSAEVETLLNDYNQHFYLCIICGRFAFCDDILYNIDKDKTMSFLYYNLRVYKQNKEKNNFFYIGNGKNFDLIKTEYPLSICVSLDEIDNWFPNSFNEKIDTILLGLSELSSYYGHKTSFENYNFFLSLLFIKRFNKNNRISDMDISMAVKWFSNYFEENNLLSFDDRHIVTVLPDGWKRIDELQKNNVNNKQVFIAMSFDESMKGVQENIEIAIRKAGYIPRVMNKIEHNNHIVPEILFEIRQSKFVIAEFSNNNNGAYYEAGYALGLGKQVIHVCNEKAFKKKGHFDIKQILTVFWNTEDEIIDKLYNRIISTII